MQLNTQVPSACANLWHNASNRDGTRAGAGAGVGTSSNARCISSYVRFLFESKRMYSSIICSPSEFFCGRAFISQLQINSTHSSGHHKKGSAAKWRTVNTQHNIPPTHTHTPTVQTNALTLRQAGRQAHSHAAGRNNISQLSKLSIKYFRIFYQKRKWLAMAGGSGSTHITQLKSIQSQLPLQLQLQLLLLLLLLYPPHTQPFSMSLLWQVICFFWPPANVFFSLVISMATDKRG